VGFDPAEIPWQVAGIDRSHAAEIARRADTDAEVRLVGPVSEVVPRLVAPAREIRDLVHLQAGAGESIDGGFIHGAFEFLVEWTNGAALPLLPERGPLLEDQAVAGEMRRT